MCAADCKEMGNITDDENGGIVLGKGSPKVWVGFRPRPPVPPAALQIGKTLSAPALPTQYSAFSPLAGTEVGTPGVPA
jgi:hypothetical protein